MKEAIRVELGGKRVGGILDRKLRKLYIEKPASEFGNIPNITIDGLDCSIEYTPAPQPVDCCPYSDPWGDPTYGCNTVDPYGPITLTNDVDLVEED